MAFTNWNDVLRAIQDTGKSPFSGMGLPEPAGWTNDLPFWSTPPGSYQPGSLQDGYTSRSGTVPTGYTNPFQQDPAGMTKTLSVAPFTDTRSQPGATITPNYGPNYNTNTQTGGTAPESTGAAGGVMPPGWQTPVGDPFGALINSLQSQGRFIDPFNKSLMGGMQHIAAGLIPQYFAQLLSQGDSDFAGGNTDTQFGEFLKNMTQGTNIAAPLYGYGRASEELGNIDSLMRQVKAAVGGMQAGTGTGQIDWTNPASIVAAIQGQKGFNPKQKSIAGLLLGDNAAQQAYYLGSYAPSLGPDMLQGLGNVVGAQRSAWQRYMEAAYGQTNQPMSFIDLLTNSLKIPFQR